MSTSGNGLAMPARARVDDLESLLSECDEVRKLAIGKIRTYKDRNGEEHSYDDPDLRSALVATELKAKLLGLLKDSKQTDPNQLSDAQVRAELERRGYSLPKLRSVK